MWVNIYSVTSLFFVEDGVDCHYTTVSINATIFAGYASQSFNVFLNDDNILAPTEQFEVVIKAIHLIAEQQPIPLVVLGAITVANGTILDDDGKLVIFCIGNRMDLRPIKE